MYVDPGDRSLKVKIDALPRAGQIFHMLADFKQELLPVEPGLMNGLDNARGWNENYDGEHYSTYVSDEDPEWLPPKKRARKK